MSIIKNLFSSSLGRKFLMALTGLGLFGFVIGHLLGNLQVFLGAETLNAYGALLKSSAAFLWTARLGLLAMVALHIWTAVTLAGENKAARPVGYAGNPAPKAASYASRTMIVSGLIIFFFILYHLLHFTVLVDFINFTGQDFHDLVDAKGRHDVYAMLVIGFRAPAVTLFYLVAVALLCLHLGHGLGAMCQSLGLKNQTHGPLLDRAANGVAAVIFLGYASIPLAVLCGLIGQEVAR